MLPPRPRARAVAPDRIAQSMAAMLLALPLLLALALTGRFLAREAGATRPSAPAVVEARETVEKPIITQAVLRPRKNAVIQAAMDGEPAREQLMAMAFMPHVGTIVTGTLTSGVADLPTASTGAAEAPRFNTRMVESRPWRAQTLRNVGVAEGLRLISGGAMLTLAGVEPLSGDAQCKRLDGVMEPCAVRAASRLEVLTRGRAVTCQVFDAQQGEPTVAKCKADKIDIAEDLVKHGLARRA